jgi:hypothetical protein
VPGELIGRRSLVSVITGVVVIPDAAFPWALHVADAAEYVVSDDGGDLLFVPAFEGSQQVGVLLHRFRMWPAGLRPAGE